MQKSIHRYKLDLITKLIVCKCKHFFLSLFALICFSGGHRCIVLLVRHLPSEFAQRSRIFREFWVARWKLGVRVGRRWSGWRILVSFPVNYFYLFWIICITTFDCLSRASVDVQALSTPQQVQSEEVRKNVRPSVGENLEQRCSFSLQHAIDALEHLVEK